MDHIFRDISAGELPEQTPIDELIGVERLRRTAIQECVPIQVVWSAIGGNRADPLSVAVLSVAAHP